MPNGEREMRAWRLHEYGRPTEVLKARHGARPGTRRRRAAGAGAGHPVQPQRPRTHHRRQHDGAPRAAVQPGDGSHGRRRRVRRGRRRVAGSPRRRDAQGRARRLREYAICPAVSAFDMPETIPLPGAAALYFPFHLAWLGLFDRAELQAGESVLIHAAAGGSGSAAIQLAKHAERVSSPRPGPTRRCSCVATSAPTSPSTTTTPISRKSCSPRPANRGVEVVFDNVGEAVMEKSMQCTAYNGRYLMMGFASNKLVADEPFIVPPRRARELQALRRAARLRGTGHVGDAQDRDGLELRAPRSRESRSCATSSRSCSSTRSNR